MSWPQVRLQLHLANYWQIALMDCYGYQIVGTTVLLELPDCWRLQIVESAKLLWLPQRRKMLQLGLMLRYWAFGIGSAFFFACLNIKQGGIESMSPCLKLGMVTKIITALSYPCYRVERDLSGRYARHYCCGYVDHCDSCCDCYGSCRHDCCWSCVVGPDRHG